MRKTGGGDITDLEMTFQYVWWSEKGGPPPGQPKAGKGGRSVYYLEGPSIISGRWTATTQLWSRNFYGASFFICQRPVEGDSIPRSILTLPFPERRRPRSPRVGRRPLGSCKNGTRVVDACVCDAVRKGTFYLHCVIVGGASMCLRLTQEKSSPLNQTSDALI